MFCSRVGSVFALEAEIMRYSMCLISFPYVCFHVCYAEGEIWLIIIDLDLNMIYIFLLLVARLIYLLKVADDHFTSKR